jgi:methionyl-tRNA synthetase
MQVPFGNDGDFSHEAFVRRVNANLANELGNLFQRTLAFIAKNCGGEVPEPQPLEEMDETLFKQVYSTLDTVRPLVAETQALHRYSEALNQVRTP